MLHPDDAAAMIARFGAAAEQIRRDHLVSHLLAALTSCDAGELVLFGGTGLSYSYLRRGRLSEDVDLLIRPWRPVTEWLEHLVPRSLRREFPGLSWRPLPTQVAERGSALLTSPSGQVVKVQVVPLGPDHRLLPRESVRLENRYRDVPATELCLPTVRAFAVMKAAAWSERRTARDLFDLARLNELGVIDAETAGLARQLLGRRIRGYDFTGRAPADWQQQLAHQTTHLPDPQECLGLVGQAWEAAARALSPDG